MSILSWIKGEAASLHALYHQTIQSIHNELDRLEGIAQQAQAKADAHIKAAEVLQKAAGEAAVLSSDAREAATKVRSVL